MIDPFDCIISLIAFTWHTIQLEHTLLRFHADVKANSSSDSVGRWMDSVRRLPLVLNGDWRKQCFHVFIDADDFVAKHLIHDRTAMVEFVCTAIIQTGMFGGILTSICAKSRWGTCAAANGVSAAGRFCHGVGRRRFRNKKLCFSFCSTPNIRLTINRKLWTCGYSVV